jgi:1-acyl-sn-glycerol-3-phosphate acyltransferase
MTFTTPSPYSFKKRLINAGVRFFTRCILRIDARALDQIPPNGPLIVTTNHVNFLEAPVLYTQLAPRPATAFAKAESWDSSLIGRLFDAWEIIPVRRGEADLAAMKRGVKVLKSGAILGISPEGTRSKTGQLQQGHPGVIMLAQMSKAAIIPIGCYGHEHYRENLSRLRRSEFKIVVGRPFRLDAGGQRVTGAIRQQMVDEIMYQTAAILPPEYRGVYSDLSKATTQYLKFIDFEEEQQ